MKIFKNQALIQFMAVAAFLSVTMWSASPVYAASISVTPSALNVTVGQTFSVDVFISGVSDLYAFQFDIGYDPSILSAGAISEGAFLLEGGSTLWDTGSINNSGGVIDDTFGSLQSIVPGVDGSGVLASINFTALAAGSSNISLFDIILLDSQIFDIDVSSVSSTNILVNAQTIPDPTVPEPATVFLLIIGLIGLTSVRRKAFE